MTAELAPVVLTARKGAVAWITLNRPQAMNAINDEMRKGATPRLDNGMQREADLLALLLGTEDRRKAGRAFREKRKPQFKGK